MKIHGLAILGLHFALFGALNASAAYAGKVGDVATFKSTQILSNGTVQSKIMEMKRIAEDLIEFTSIYRDGTTSSSTGVSPFPDENTIPPILANCSAANGASENMVIATGENILTCRISSDEITLNLANVPFGAARIIYKYADQTVTHQLISYRRAR